MIKYDIAFSGSSGNAVLINDILFDIGITSRNPKMKELIDKSVAIFISHKHGDHLNLTTYRYINKLYPLKPIYGNKTTTDFIKERTPKLNHDDLHTFKNHDVIDLCNGNQIIIFKTKHEQGVDSTAYEGITKDLDSFVYATDFWDWNDLPQDHFNDIFVEANHDKNYEWYLHEIEELGGPKLQPWIIRSTGRHTTKQDALKYFELHKLNNNSKFIPLHKSSRFYDMSDYRDKIDEMLGENNDKNEI